MSSLSDIHKAIEKLVEDRLRSLSRVLELDLDRVLEENKKLSKEVTLKKKKNRDPNRPKQPDNSYLLFTRDCRAIIKGEDVSSLFPKSLKKTVESAVKELRSQTADGSLSSKMFTKRLGALWKSKEMEKHKKAYEDEAAKKREVYKKECSSYDSKVSSESKSAKKSSKASVPKKAGKSAKKSAPKKAGKKSKKEEVVEEPEEVEADEDEEVEVDDE